MWSAKLIVWVQLFRLCYQLRADSRLEGDRCDPGASSWYAVLNDDSHFLHCDKQTMTLKKEQCSSINGTQKIFNESLKMCTFPPAKTLFRQVDDGRIFESSKRSFHLSAAGASKVGGVCAFNTDCLNGMFCQAGICTCLSNYIEKDGFCFIKIPPNQVGCSYHEQCSAVWPNSTCSALGNAQGTCNCPTKTQAVETRDGFVCVYINFDCTDASCRVCPLPEPDPALYDIPTLLPSRNSALKTGIAFTSIGTTKPAGTAGSDKRECTYGVTAAPICSGGTVTNYGAGAIPVDELYDCISIASVPQGICCPNRAYTCSLPQLPQGSAATTTRYYYNSVSGTCLQFIWDETATIQSANNFKTLDHCNSYCRDSCPRGTTQYTTVDNTVPPYTSKKLNCQISSCDTNHDCRVVGSESYCCSSPKFICSNLGGLKSAIPGMTLAYDQGIPFYADAVDSFGVSAAYTVTGTNRYYYNAATGMCTLFTWYYQGGNFNNFASKSHCDLYCSQVLCDQGRPLTDASGNNQVCSSNSNCPSTFKCSNNVCCPKTQTVCEQPMQRGFCQNWVQRYWFNAATRECELFDYGGCQGNANNFPTLLSCQNYCRDTKVKPNCVQGDPYKDVNGNYVTCSPGTQGTCPSNYECYNDGKVWGCCTTKTYTCSSMASVGMMCGPKTVRWYFDTTSQTCQTFEYLGCDGNSNSFSSRESCEQYCGVGACPNGGGPYRENNGQIRVCSAQVICPTTHSCNTVNVGGSGTSYCCPTVASICSMPPNQGTTCSASNINRFYYSSITRKCQSFDYRGCGGNANNFATITQCQNFCNSAACGAGEISLINPSSQTVVTCNPSIANSCPGTFGCKWDQLAQKNVCCGSTDMGVCPTGEKAFVEAFTQQPRSCMPNIANSCASGYLCRFSQTRRAYFCCASSTGVLCPAGKALLTDSSSLSPVNCQVSSMTNVCPSGYSCQTTVTNSVQGFCCTSSPVCPGGSDYIKDAVTGQPRSCTVGSGIFAQCPAGYGCSPSSTGSPSGFCCKSAFTSSAGVCANLQPYVVNELPVTCSLTSVGRQGSCPANYNCERQAQTGVMYCCSASASPAQPATNFSSGSWYGDGCPPGGTVLTSGGVVVPCDMRNPSSCPVNSACVFSTAYNRFQCCSTLAGQVVTQAPGGIVTSRPLTSDVVSDGCPSGLVALSSSGQTQTCSLEAPSCSTPAYS